MKNIPQYFVLTKGKVAKSLSFLKVSLKLFMFLFVFPNAAASISELWWQLPGQPSHCLSVLHGFFSIQADFKKSV